MKRRNFLKSFSAAGLVAGTPIAQKAFGKGTYEGPIYITLQASGGWDVTSLCDPKTSYMQTNNDGSTEKIIVNNWGETKEIGTIADSEITYAPFAENEKLFTNHAEKMMILNGIDMQTNSHMAGTINTWSGRFSEGLPTFTALVAQAYGQGLPMAFVTNGGYAATSGIISPTLLAGKSGTLRNLANPNKVYSTNANNTQKFIAQKELDVINQFKKDRLNRLLARNGLPFTQKSLNQFATSQSDQNELQFLEDQLNDTTGVTVASHELETGYNNSFLDQIDLTLAAGAANLMVSADLRTSGFDTHGNHDNSHANALKRLTDGVDFLWKKAESLGIADRIRLVIGSEFSRTPKYNAGNGKDHWPVNSMIFMQKPGGAATTGKNIKFGKVFGASSQGHRALQLNPTDLSPIAYGAEDANDPKPTLQPKHVHKVLRRWAGIEEDPFSEVFDLDADDLDITKIID